MLDGAKVVLRPVRERDLAAFIDAHTEISNRGEFFPLGVQPEPVLRRNYAETGFWEGDEGTLLIWNRDDVMVGHIEFFRPVSYWDAYESRPKLARQSHASAAHRCWRYRSDARATAAWVAGWGSCSAGRQERTRCPRARAMDTPACHSVVLPIPAAPSGSKAEGPPTPTR
jgi:hypothetical protein